VKAVIDTNVLLVANEQHDGASPDCVIKCVQQLLKLQKSGVAVIDDEYRILSEYQKKARSKRSNRVGDKFLKWLLQSQYSSRVEQVALSETALDCFAEFPDPHLEPRFDPPDRKFAAVANAHPDHPPIWQAVDSKWLDWWGALKARGIEVVFLCPDDICGFYTKKFPGRPVPMLPESVT
jgi:hypothetical protein